MTIIYRENVFSCQSLDDWNEDNNKQTEEYKKVGSLE